MSLYNITQGSNPAALRILKVLNMNSEKFGRFRDASLAVKESALIFRVLTRCGGPNRETHREVFDNLKEHPLYLRDYDDSFDSTYAWFDFRIPALELPGIHDMLRSAKQKGVYDLLVNEETMKEKTDRLLAAL